MTSLRVAMKLSMADAKTSPKSAKKRSSSLGTSIEEEGMTTVRKRKLSLGDMKEKKSSEAEEGERDTEGSVNEKLSYSNPASGSDNTLNTPVNIEEEEAQSGDSAQAGLPLTEEDESSPRVSERSGTAVEDRASEEADAEESAAVVAMDTGEDVAETPAPKQKKKRNSLRNQLGDLISDAAEATAAEAGGESGRYGSGRAAAQVAKSKLMTSTPRTSTKELAAEGDEPALEAGTSGRSAAKSSKSVARAASVATTATVATAAADASVGAAVAEENVEWVQCEKCSKWRTVAPFIDMATLSEKWFCSMNTWDAKMASCAVPEVVMSATEDGSAASASAAAVSTKETTSAKKGGRGGGGRWGKQRVAKDLSASMEVAAEEGGANPEEGFTGSDREDVPEQRQPQSRRKPSARSGGGGGSGAESSETAAGGGSQVNWVQCNKCKKWRKVPESISMDDLPEKWWCTMNTWNPAYARCAAKEETDTTAAAAAAGAGAGDDDYYQAGVGGGGGGRGGAAAARQRRQAAPIERFGSPAPQGALPAIKKVSWVQCERKNCKKWRKVPAAIDTSTFPEKWFCEMNSWEPDSASCDAPEMSDSEDDHAANDNTRTQLILSNSKGPGALSYRRIIFGTDGKIRPCFSDRNRNGYGIFSCSESNKAAAAAGGGGGDADDYTEPTRRIGYWWSTAYDETGVTIATKAKKSQSAASLASLAAEEAAAGAGDKLAEKDQLPGESPTYLLDAVRRMMGMDPPREEGFARPKAIPKHGRLLAAMTVFQRQRAEIAAVRSCFLLEGTNTLPFPSLVHLLRHSHFATPEVEAVRLAMNNEVLKGTLRAMELEGNMLVSVSAAGVLQFELVKLGVMPPAPFSAEDGHSLPLKMRKFGMGENGELKKVADLSRDAEMPVHRFKRHQKWASGAEAVEMSV